MLADNLFAKVLQSLKTCLSVNNNLCGKLGSSLESLISNFSNITFIPDFKLISCELDNFAFKMLN